MVMCVNVGHGDQRVINAIVKQAQELPFAGPLFATKPRAMLGEKLCQVVPKGLTKFLYTLGGADANENAIKLARGYTGRYKILTRYRSYHSTYGARGNGDPRDLVWDHRIQGWCIPRSLQNRSTFIVRTHPFRAGFHPAFLNHLEENSN